MDPAEYGFAIGRGLQDTFSNVLMGLREERANKDLSLRERQFAMQQRLGDLQYQQAQKQMDLQDATVSGAPMVADQFQGLHNYAYSDNFDALKNASYKDVSIPGASPYASQAFNNAQRQQFEATKTQLLSASAGMKNRLQDINNLSEYSLSLSSNPMDRGIADETRIMLQAGAPVPEIRMT